MFHENLSAPLANPMNSDIKRLGRRKLVPPQGGDIRAINCGGGGDGIQIVYWHPQYDRNIDSKACYGY